MMCVGFAWYSPKMRPGWSFCAFATASFVPAMCAARTPLRSIASCIFGWSLPWCLHRDYHVRLVREHYLAHDEARREALPPARIAGALQPAREGDDVAHLAGDAGVGSRTGALVCERRDRDLPALVQAADHVLARDAHLVEEDLVEPGDARHLDQRPDRDAG